MTAQPRLSLILLAVALGLAGLVAAGGLIGCSTPQGDDRRDLREVAIDESISRTQRVATLLAVLEDGRVDPHLRGTAAQMLGVLRSWEAVPALFEVLGYGYESTQPVTDRESWLAAQVQFQPLEAGPESAVYLRMEAVEALGRFGIAPIYQGVFQAVGLEQIDPSFYVRHAYVDSFRFATPDARTERADVAFVLLLWLRTVQVDRDPSPVFHESLVANAVQSLRRLTGRADLTAADLDEWEAELAAMRSVRETASMREP